MKPHDQPSGLCSIDPITLTGLALGLAGGIGGAAAGGAFSGSSSPASPTPQAPPPQAPPPSAPQGSKKSNMPSQPSFVGAAPTAPIQSGQKTLLGQ